MRGFICALLLAMTSAAIAADAIPTVPAPITKIEVFKNGMAAVSREAKVAGKKEFYLDENMLPGIGTLWLEPAGLRVTRLEKELSFDVPVAPADYNEVYRGKEVAIVVAWPGNSFREFHGTVVTPEQPKSPIRVSWSGDATVVMKLHDGRFVSFPKNSVHSIFAQEIPSRTQKVQRKRPYWLVQSQKNLDHCKIAYVTQGIFWHPSYRIMLSGEKKMRMEFAAELENKLEDITKTEVKLLAGMPRLLYAHQKDPMGIFFDSGNVPAVHYELSGAQYFSAPKSRAAEKSLNTADSYSTPSSEDMFAILTETVSLKKGEVLRFPTQSVEGTCEKLVRWNIPARIAQNNFSVRTKAPVKNNVPMDCLQFNNPFSVPITSAPLEIVQNNQVVAQTDIEWINPDAQALVELTQALTVTGKVTEYEVANSLPDKAERVFGIRNKNPQAPVRIFGELYGRTYRLTDIKGLIELKNHRKTAVNIRVELNYCGELISADGKFEDRPGARIGSINPERLLVWNLTLKPGEESKLHYRYNVILDR